MARVFWKGVISFGMVAIPVRMLTATNSKTPDFHYLHKKCLTRPKQVLYCEHDDEYIDKKETVKGYEFSKGQYLVLKESDFENVPLKTTHAIDIRGFVEAKEINPIYFYGSHYLEPEELAVKPFMLLRDTLNKTGKVGIAKVSFQRREHLCCLRPFEEVMLLNSLHFHNEIIPLEKPSYPKQEISEPEIEMATNLINAMSKAFKPQEFHDEYEKALNELIKAKLSGQEVKQIAAPKYEVKDLMSALKASIESAKKETEAKEVVGARKR